MKFIQKIKDFIAVEVTLEDLADPRKSIALAKRILLFALEMFRSVIRHQTFMQASSLAFKTLMALVPMLFIGLAVASALGETDGKSYAESFISAIEAKLPQSPALEPLINLIKGFASRAKEIVGIGFIILFYTAYSLLSSIEVCFNRIWQVRGSRKLLNRCLSYLAVVILVPILMSLSVYLGSRVESAAVNVFDKICITADNAISMISRIDQKQPKNSESPEVLTAPESATPQKHESDETNSKSLWLTKYLLALGSLAVTCFALMLLFYFMPFTQVSLKPAIIAGIFSGIFIEATKLGCSFYASYSATNFTRLYGSTLLAFPLFLLWLWLIWVFILLGAEISFNLQNYHELAASAEMEKKGLHYKLYLSVRTVLTTCEYFHIGKDPQNMADNIAQQLSVPQFAIRSVLILLTERGILRVVEGGKDGYLPAKDIAQLTVGEVIRAVSDDDYEIPDLPNDEAQKMIKELFDKTNAAFHSNLDSVSFHKLLELEHFDERLTSEI